MNDGRERGKRLCLRRPRPGGGPDAELTFGVLFFPLCGLVTWLLGRFGSRLVPVCMFHRVTGLPCGTCGTFRGYSSLVAGELAGALRLQPFMVTLAILAAVYSVYAWIVVVGRLPRLRVVGVGRRAKWFIGLVVAALFLANWIFLVADGR